MRRESQLLVKELEYTGGELSRVPTNYPSTQKNINNLNKIADAHYHPWSASLNILPLTYLM